MKRAREDPPGVAPVVKRQNTAPTQEPPRSLRVEDALEYLSQVKLQFGDSPDIYNQFLDIMKNFKAHTLTTPGVIKRVSELFKGHNNLILGFNTFLPAGFKITLPLGEAQPTLVTSGPATTAATAQTPAAPVPVQPAAPVPQPQAAPVAAPAEGGGAGAGGAAAGGAGGGGAQPVEFDQAINYVTKIKRRYSNDPKTYRSFLDILHTYQQEERSINEVLQQVSSLFRDQPDLLQEFTFFLPDTVQEHAKQTLEKLRKKAARGRARAERDAAAAAAAGGRDKAGRARKRPRKVEEAVEARLPLPERRFFDSLHAALGQPELWQQFLKCLSLYTQQLLSRAELLSLVADLFTACHRPDLLQEFKRILVKRAGGADESADIWFSMPLSEIDFSRCKRCTPSYRLLPDDYPRPACSERSPLCSSVLNDHLVSVPTGSEDFSFKNMRRNVYEEALFRCEDDHYEVDLVIDTNASAIRALTPLAEEIAILQRNSAQAAAKAKAAAQGGGAGQQQQPSPPPGVFSYRLDKRSLSVIQLKAIARLYGENGMEILELLRRNPGGAIPIILARLKQKDVEWRKARDAMAPQWRAVLQNNYPRSLDHRSFYFKQSDKKRITSKALLAQVKAAAAAAATAAVAAAAAAESKTAEPASDGAAAAAASTEEGEEAKAAAAAGGDAAAAATPAEASAAEGSAAEGSAAEAAHMSLCVGDSGVHRDAAGALFHSAERAMAAEDCRKLALLWRGVLQGVVGPPSLPPSPSDLSVTDGASHWLGRTVSTPYGEGVVEGTRPHLRMLLVTLPWATATLQPSVVSLSPRDPLLLAQTHARAAAAGTLPPAPAAATAAAAAPGEAATEGEAAAAPEAQAAEAEAAEPAVEGGGVEGEVEMGEAEGSAPASAPAPDAVPDAAPPSRVPYAVLEAEPRRSMLLYGNNALYVFCKLHHMFYQRLLCAKQLCRDFLPANTAKPTAASAAAKKSEEGADSSAAAAAAAALAAEQGEQRYQIFLAALYSFLDGDMDGSRFEEQCRSLMGTAAYSLFTIDKLMYALMKAATALLRDTCTQRLLALHSYRAAATRYAAADSAAAAAAADVVLSDSGYLRAALCAVEEEGSSDGLYKLQLRGDDCSEVGEEQVALNVWLVSVELPEEGEGSAEDVNAKMAETQWPRYLELALKAGAGFEIDLPLPSQQDVSSL